MLKNLLFLFYTTGRKYKIKRAHFSFFKDFQVLFTKSKHFSRPWRRNFVFKHFQALFQLFKDPHAPCSSHQAFFWKCTWTSESHAFLYCLEIWQPFPRKSLRGLTWGSPSANMVSCTVHCHLSSPDCPPQTHTKDAPLNSNIFPPPNTKGREVWSMFAIDDKFRFPKGVVSCCKLAVLRPFCHTNLWNIWMTSSMFYWRFLGTWCSGSEANHVSS